MKNNVFTVQGQIKSIDDVRTVGAKNAKVREFVVETTETYPQLLKFELFQEKTDAVNQFSEGSGVTVYFSVRGREWEGKVYNSLRAFRVDSADKTAADTRDAEAFREKAGGKEDDEPVF